MSNYVASSSSYPPNIFKALPQQKSTVLINKTAIPTKTQGQAEK